MLDKNEFMSQLEKAKERIRSAQNKFEKYINEKRNFAFYNIGEKVMYRNNTQTGLEFKHIGPWLIIERVSWVEYRIQLSEDAKIRRFANIEHLKFYHSSEFEIIEQQLQDRYNDFVRKSVPKKIRDSCKRGLLFDN